jgi:phytoene dehydrogenase-like protein
MNESIIVIGAGIAGLSTGCYAQMNGYRTQVFEKHSIPGGLCTSWKRKGYVIDGCIHHLAGSGPASPLYRIWQELGVFPGTEMVFHDEITRVEAPDGRAFIVYTDIERLAQHMRALSPADGPAIETYIRAARQFTHMDLLAIPATKPWEMVKMLPYAPALIKWMRITLKEYSQRFSDPFLRRAFPTIQYDFSGIPTAIHLNFLASCHNRTLGWPRGGSLAFARAIEKRYLGLGGQAHYASRVEKILVENDRAVGVLLDDGTEHRADVVISAADGHATTYSMLEGQYADEDVRAYYGQAPNSQQMNFHISLGVARDMSHEPHALTYFFPEPVTILGQECDRLSVEVFNFDPSMAPPGKSVVKVLLEARYARWRELYDDRERYDAEKQRIAEVVIALLEQRFPGLTEQIKVVDVATPVTVERYTGNWQGLQAWMSPKGGLAAMLRGANKTLPGLENLYMVGQWAGGIGISTAAMSGRSLVRTLCRRDGRPFVHRVT